MEKAVGEQLIYSGTIKDHLDHSGDMLNSLKTDRFYCPACQGDGGMENNCFNCGGSGWISK